MRLSEGEGEMKYAGEIEGAEWNRIIQNKQQNVIKFMMKLSVPVGRMNERKRGFKYPRARRESKQMKITKTKSSRAMAGLLLVGSPPNIETLQNPTLVYFQKVRRQCYINNNFCFSQGRSQGGGREEIPPRNRKKLLQKNGVISEGSIFSNKFSKKIK